ncbi:MAG: signal recognition particle-docking protein FtsY [Desulfovibrio sp.]|nr:signal recognition particle-docking protein FtsY [Desulfovibrio sp.]
MGFFSTIKKIFGASDVADGDTNTKVSVEVTEQHVDGKGNARLVPQENASGPESAPIAEKLAADADAMILRLRQAEPRLSAWLAIVLEGVEETGDLLWQRLRFLLQSLQAPEDEASRFLGELKTWLDRMEYRYVDEYRSELQYRLALALNLEDEEDERSRLFIKITEGLAKTRAHLSQGLDRLFADHGELDDRFWEDMEELFIMADLGYEASVELVRRLRERARQGGVTDSSAVRRLLRDELEEIFRIPPHIVAVNPPEVVLMIGVNGVGKTTTIGKLANRARMQGKKVMIAAADTFRAAAIEQLQVWAERSGALFHSRPAGSDPASVAYEAMDRAVAEGVDLLFVDTAGRLQTKVNLMEELTKIRQVIAKKHPGAPHRTVLVIDATTGQNALSQTKLFKEAAGVDELILTKLDGTAKGGVAIAVAMQHHLPITFVGLGEKMEDLRPFDGGDYARALLGEGHEEV